MSKGCIHFFGPLCIVIFSCILIWRQDHCLAQPRIRDRHWPMHVETVRCSETSLLS